MDAILSSRSKRIDRCLKRVEEEYTKSEGRLESDLLCQDSIILNIQRACQAAIDIGCRVIRLKQLPLPEQTADIFDALADEGDIPIAMANQMKKMIGFRNIALYEDQNMDVAILQAVVENYLPQIRRFADKILAANPGQQSGE